MKKTLKKYFIPHEDNNYHPHILHAKRMAWYGGLFVVMKAIVLIFVFVLPFSALVMPDVLLGQQQKIIALTNDLREQKGLPQLAIENKLNTSADNKAMDMARRQYFSHKGPDGKTVSDWIREAGYSYSVAGENLAMGFPSAEEVVNAWIKSPTHYANLIDPDYQAIGVGLESGLYNGQDTVYLAEHLAVPQPATKAIIKSSSAANLPASEVIIQPRSAAEEPVLEKSTASKMENVLALKVDNSVVYDADNSTISWQEKGNKTLLSVEAKISGPVKSAVVEVASYPIELKADSQGIYRGEYLAREPVDNFFRVATLPTIKIVGADDKIITANINWLTLKAVGLTPIQKYIKSKELLASITNIFSVSRNIYLAFIIFFALALFLNIIIEIKKQHPHVILWTLGLLSLLICFWLV